MPPFLILLIFLLPLGAGAEEIIGGHEVRPHSRPYMAFVHTQNVDGKNGSCGGFLVKDNFVLTAAHCWSSDKVTLGAHNIHQKEKTQQIIRVARFIRHPDYEPNGFFSDIMLLKLASRAKLTKAVRPLRLPKANDQVRPGSVCRLAGWGLMSHEATSKATLLQEAELTIQEEQECKRTFHNYSKTTQICAGDPEKRMAPFMGDSGGPLVCDNSAYGVLAYGKCKGISPAVFTKISSFLPWIRSNMKLL